MVGRKRSTSEMSLHRPQNRRSKLWDLGVSLNDPMIRLVSKTLCTPARHKRYVLMSVIRAVALRGLVPGYLPGLSRLFGFSLRMSPVSRSLGHISGRCVCNRSCVIPAHSPIPRDQVDATTMELDPGFIKTGNRRYCSQASEAQTGAKHTAKVDTEQSTCLGHSSSCPCNHGISQGSPVRSRQ